MTHQVLHVHVLRVLRRARVGGEPWAAGARGWKPSPVAFVGPRVPRRATGLCTTSPPISARIRMTACGTGPSSSLSRRERGQHKCFWDRFLELNLAPMGLFPTMSKRDTRDEIGSMAVDGVSLRCRTACTQAPTASVHRRLHRRDNTGAHPSTLQANGLCHNLAVDIGITIDHFTLFGTAEIELEIVFFGETDAPMDMVRCGADAAAGIARPGLSHGDLLGRLLPIGQAPRRTVSDEA